MRSALFVDFDNVYSGLRKLDPVSADRFARQPLQWVNWLIADLPAPEHAAADAKRRLLVRRVYLNPQVYQRYRPAFNHAGFEIIDCPAMTSEGKTSTDIHMVLDMIDLLQHPVHYDEFIVFSADADFTPVLRKLRRSDRRTTVLAVGFPSAAYRASADLLIDQESFVRDALGRSDEDMALAAPALGGATGPVLSSAGSGFFTLAPAAPALRPAAPTRGWADREADLRLIADQIRTEVGRTERPVPGARLATLILREYPWLAEDWHGHGNFRRFLEALALDGLALDWSHSGGYVLDPARHTAPPARRAELVDASTPPEGWANDVALFQLVRQVHHITGVPLLAPAAFRGLLDAVVADVQATPFQLSDTGKQVRDRCRAQGLDVSREDVNWVLRGLLLSGHEFDPASDDVPTLAYKLVGNLINLCRREQMPMDESTAGTLHRWVSGRVAEREPADAAAGR